MRRVLCRFSLSTVSNTERESPRSPSAPRTRPRPNFFQSACSFRPHRAQRRQILLSPKINQSLRRPNSFSCGETIRVPALQEGAGLVKPGQLAHNTCWRRTRATTEELWASSTQRTNVTAAGCKLFVSLLYRKCVDTSVRLCF